MAHPPGWENGFVVVRLEKFLPAKLDDGTRQRMLDELYNNWLAEQVKKCSEPSAGRRCQRRYHWRG